MATRIAQLATEQITQEFADTMNAAAGTAGLSLSLTLAEAQFIFGYFAADANLQAAVAAALNHQAEIQRRVKSLETMKAAAVERDAPQGEIDALQAAIDGITAAHAEAFAGE